MQASAASSVRSTVSDAVMRIIGVIGELPLRACAEPAESISRIEGDENGEPAGQHRVASGQNGVAEPTSKRQKPGRGKRRKRAPLADLLGRDVVLDGRLFSTPGTTYAARIMKKVPVAATSSSHWVWYTSCCTSAWLTSFTRTVTRRIPRTEVPSSFDSRRITPEYGCQRRK